MNKVLKYGFIGVLTVLFVLNVVAFFHAYKFTHFIGGGEKTKQPDELSVLDKVGTLVFGVNLPKPQNDSFPEQEFETISIKSNKEIKCWYIKHDKHKGVVAIFHGYGGEKSAMLDKADEFFKMGYSTLVVDFMGSGESEGVQTTIGFYEADQVKSCYDYLRNQGEESVYLYGGSMGAVAIIKAIDEYEIKPNAIIVECPFGEMYKTVCARFEIMGLPSFPMASLLTFWGGVQNGFWAFAHNPIAYAESIECPVLLMYGEKDRKVSKEEIDELRSNIKSRVVYRGFEQAGHENYLIRYKEEWRGVVSGFLYSM